MSAGTGAFVDLLKRAYRGSGLRDARLKRRFERSLTEWRALQAELGTRDDEGVSAEDAPAGTRAVIVPPDPLLLLASRGDEAMILATLERVRTMLRPDEIHMVTCSDAADAAAGTLGVTPLRALDSPGLRVARDALARIRPTHVYALGADALDGHSDPNFSLRLVAIVDLAARLGAEARVLGFSFSARAHPGMRRVYEAAHPSVVFHLRDPRSLERFRAFCTAPSRGVGDVAFMLAPRPDDAGTARARRWIAERRAAGDTVLGFNVHPLVLPLERRHRLEATLDVVADELRAVVASGAVSIVLLAHDFRGAAADAHCHAPLFRAVAPAAAARWFDVDAPLSAAALKGLAGELDGMISGRMHLSIATLGMGVPVLAIDYNDKTGGLMEHFGLDAGAVLPGTALGEPGLLRRRIADFVADLPAIRSRVRSRLERVRELSHANFTEPRIRPRPSGPVAGESPRADPRRDALAPRERRAW